MKIYEKGIIGFIAFMFILIVGLQLGIYRGRVMERAEIKAEFQVLNNEIKELERVMADYEHALEVYQILKCESSYRHNVWGDNGEYGISQFKKDTFNWLHKISQYKNKKMDWKNKNDQIILLSWAVKNNYGKYWTCYRRLYEQ